MGISLYMRWFGLLTFLTLVGCGCGQDTDSRPAQSNTTQSSTELSVDSEEDAKTMSDDTAGREELMRSEDEWKELLTPEQHFVLRQKGTERPFTNEFDEHFEPGVYSCAGCGQELFSSVAKFNSGCGWPAFYAAKAEERVVLTPDHSQGMSRTEVTCAKCGSHLGHLFDDAPQTPTGNRYCINSVSLTFTPLHD